MVGYFQRVFRDEYVSGLLHTLPRGKILDHFICYLLREQMFRQLTESFQVAYFAIIDLVLSLLSPSEVQVVDRWRATFKQSDLLSYKV